MGITSNDGVTAQVQVVKGGFILSIYDGHGSATTEVFTSTGRLIKALRGVIETKDGDAAAPAEVE